MAAAKKTAANIWQATQAFVYADPAGGKRTVNKGDIVDPGVVTDQHVGNGLVVDISESEVTSGAPRS